MSKGDSAAPARSNVRPVDTEAKVMADNEDLAPGHTADDGDLIEVGFHDLIRARQRAQLPVPLAGTANLPLGDLDPEVFERLAAEMIKRRANYGAHFYGRRGQKQHGLDIVERDSPASNSVYQVRRYEVLTPDHISSAVTEYADPKPPKKGGEKPPRRFGASRYVLFTSAEFEKDTALQDKLEDLQELYSGDLVIEVWGREMISAQLRDSGAHVSSIFGPDWARSFCGFAPPPPSPADPNHFGLVEDPVEVLNLGAFTIDAQARDKDDPLGAAHLYGVVADTLEEAGFPGHAVIQRRQQVQLLLAGQQDSSAFDLLWNLALASFRSGTITMPRAVHDDLEVMRPRIDEVRAAKLDVLLAAQSWYERGSQLELAVPALEVLSAATEADAAFLACVILEQAVVDGWFDFDPPRSLVDPGSNNTNLLSRLRNCAARQSCADVVTRARLACAIADASLTAGSGPAETSGAFGEIMRKAGAGRYRHADGLIFARAAHALAMHGDTEHAIDLWRQAILRSSESRMYGDVVACRQAVNTAILEQPVPRFSELGYPVPLPNSARLLAADQAAELHALRAAHAGDLPDAFGATRRCQWESRLSGHITDERDAMKLFGDVLLAADRPGAAVTAWVMAGAAKKAADQAKLLATPLEMETWLASPVRARQAAAAQVIGAQARLYEPAAAEQAAHQLLDLTTDLWTSPRIAPNPALDAVNALCRFGRSLPASAVNPIIELLRPLAEAGSALTPETAELLIQLYWAVPGRRRDLAGIIRIQLALSDPPPFLWEMVTNLPEQAREPVTEAVSELADAGNREALRALAGWGIPTPTVQLAARRASAQLLRHRPGASPSSWNLSTHFKDAVSLVRALAKAGTPAEIDPRQLRPGTSPIMPAKTLFTMTVSGPAADETGPLPSPPAEGQTEATPVLPSQRQAEPVTGPSAGAGSGESPVPEPDHAALIAAGPLQPLVAAIAEHLLGTAETSSAPAFVRADALAALHQLIELLAPEVNANLVGRLLAITQGPGLNDFDEAELASQDRLSRMRLDLGARNLPVFALVIAAGAADSAAGASVVRLPSATTQRLIANGIRMVHSPDRETAHYGATALALASRSDPAMAFYAAALVIHPSDEIRAVAAQAVRKLDVLTQRVLAADPSPRVRAALASRAAELADDALEALRADSHVEVKRALAAAAEP